MLYYDADTEGKEGTRLPKGVREYGTPLGALERYTGADLLISPYDDLALPDRLSDLRPVRMALKKHCRDGLLVQRATGRDALNHIKDLKHFHTRMAEWSPHCFFLVVGYIGLNVKSGKATINRKATGWHYTAYQGAIASFQMLGGRLASLCHDGAILPWIKMWENNLRKVLVSDEDHLDTPKPMRSIIPSKGGAEQLSTLATLPNIGIKRAQALLGKLGTLASCFEWLSCPELYDPDFHPAGLNKTHLSEIQAWFGMDTNQRISVDRMYSTGFPVTIKWPAGTYTCRLTNDGKSYAWADASKRWHPANQEGHTYWSEDDFIVVVVTALSDDELAAIFAGIVIEELKRS